MRLEHLFNRLPLQEAIGTPSSRRLQLQHELRQIGWRAPEPCRCQFRVDMPRTLHLFASLLRCPAAAALCFSSESGHSNELLRISSGSSTSSLINSGKGVLATTVSTCYRRVVPPPTYRCCPPRSSSTRTPGMTAGASPRSTPRRWSPRRFAYSPECLARSRRQHD